MNILKFKEKWRALLGIDDSPRLVAFSFAIGIFIGFSPFLGLHTVACIACAFIFRLNKPAIIAGTYIANPFTLIPIYIFNTWVGLKIYGRSGRFPDIDVGHTTMSGFLNALGDLLWPFVVGCTVVGLITAAAGYFFLLLYYKTKKTARPGAAIYKSGAAIDNTGAAIDNTGAAIDDTGAANYNTATPLDKAGAARD